MNETPHVAAVKMNIEAYFPTLVGFQDWPDAEALNEQLKTHIYAWREEDPKGIERSNLQALDGWHSGTEMHERPGLSDFAARVTGAVQSYLNELGGDPELLAVCDSMWANISPKFAYNRQHSHGNALCSGVYYVQADPARSGIINFYDPRVQAIAVPKYTDEAKKRRSHTWPKVFFTPKPGRIIIFPGWLAHDVEPNLSEAEGQAADRISISFNFYLRKS